MKGLRHIIATGVAIITMCGSAGAQQINTLYFMNNIQERSDYNPAFQPVHGFYLDLPVLPNFRMSFGNNSLRMQDIFQRKNINGTDSLLTPLHPDADRAKFHKRLHQNTTISTGLTLNILNFGFRFKEKNFLTVGINEKIDMNANLPLGLFDLLLYGTDTIGSNSFNLSRLGFDATAYTEFSVGYSRIVNDKWTVGGKVKYLMGQANVSTSIKKLKVHGGADKWAIDGDGEIRASIPKTNIPIDPDGTVNYNDMETNNLKWTDFFTGNWGLGLDLGATFQVLPCLQLSAAITDLGFIRWRESTTTAGLIGGYEFNGINYGVADDIDTKWEKIKDEFENAFNSNGNNDHYTTYLRSRLNVGAEYNVWDNRFGLGLLSSTLFYPKNITSNLTASANFRPTTWFSTTVSYTLLDGQYNTFGAGIQFRVAPWNMYIAVDRIPLHFTENTYIPYDMKHVNLQAGVVFELGWKLKKKDSDRDGVSDRKDKCPNTPFGYIVDKKGCMLDQDSDRVADNVDQCPNTPIGVKVDTLGCPLDEDKDGVPDYMDKCPKTPEGVSTDSTGCPLDEDNDGVPDYKDKCPKTPKEAIGKVDSTGCPMDTDKDGVPDYLDQCPNTPETARNMVDAEGCTPDSDGDGVPDDIDKCPGTPEAARATVDETGCPKDSDGDGVPDYLDKCPTMPGTTTNYGCPELKANVKRVFHRAMKGILFQTGKDVILPKSFPILNEVAKVLEENPDFRIEINGHTDNVGKPDANLRLSDKRANAVMKYLIKKGIAAERMGAFGFGDTKPIDTNKTAKGRANNRRVEFVVKGEE